jgi:hypothetical protein
VLTLLRVISAQNAAQMKHEIAMVRLLQFSLTASNLCCAVMRAVELAELAELMTSDEPNEEDEGAEAGGSAEKREVALDFAQGTRARPHVHSVRGSWQDQDHARRRG